MKENRKNNINKPNVKLFIMSYCPFGMEAQKALLPVYDLLKNKADIGIYFINFIMHGKKELEENLRQYCIQKENKDKYFVYLSHFIDEQKSDKCLTKTGLDVNKINTHITQIDKQFKITENYNNKATWLEGQYPLFDVQKDINEQYGIEISPTLIINDKEVQTEISPEGFKRAICGAFSLPPIECFQKLPEEA
jgi:protein-disulfide isomerase